MRRSMKNIMAASGLAFLTAGVALEGAVAEIEIQEVVSPKGITAWLVEDHSLPIVGLSVAFAGGSSQDPADKPGVANMLSGLLDEGAGLMDSAAFHERLDELSIELSYDAGRDNFYGTLRTLTENLDEAAELMKYSLRWPRFDEEPMERIRDQIVSNLRFTSQRPNRVAGRALMEAAFPDHVYGQPTEGTPESVAAITRADLESFRRQTFARDGLTVAAVGNIDAERLGLLLDEIFGGMRATGTLTPVEDAAVMAGAPVSVDMNVPQSSIRFISPGILRDDPDFIAAFVATHILGGGGFSSRLFQEIREKRGLAYSVSAGLGSFDHAGFVSGGTSTRSDQAADVVELLTSEIRRYAEEGPTEEELRKAKAYLIGSYPLRFTNSTRIARQLLGIQLDDLGIDYVDRRNGMIEALTMDDVKAAAQRLFAGDNLRIVTVGPPQS